MKSPLNVYIIWHPQADETCRPLAEACFQLLNRDADHPFSRGIRIPVFYRCVSEYEKQKPELIDLSASKKTIVIALVGNHFLGNESWCTYLKALAKEIRNTDAASLQMVEVSKNAWKIGLDNVNGFRLHDMNSAHWNTDLTCFVAHELCRLLKKAREETEQGVRLTDKPVRVFLSHAKADKQVVQLVRAVKNALDNSPIARFFDAYDIPPGSDFSEEIEGRIGESILLAFRSDAYSSRPWCQREALVAKQRNCPILIVDLLERYEDRAFPYLANVPVLHMGTVDSKMSDDSTQDIVNRIIHATMLEHLRFSYSEHYFNCFTAPSSNVKILKRPPEPFDILHLDLSKETLVLYPDPPLEKAELKALSPKAENLTFATPLTKDMGDVAGLSIGLSLSQPSDIDLAQRGLSLHHVNVAVQEITMHLMNRETQLCYGGDFRAGGYTEFVCEKARGSKMMMGDSFKKIRNYIAWPIWLKQDSDWIADRFDVAKFVKVDPPQNLLDAEWISAEEFSSPASPRGRLIWNSSLKKMRMAMIESNQARVCLGGQLLGYSGMIPGVVQEILITLDLKKPLYLLGGFGGATAAVCDAIQGQRNASFHDDAQNNDSRNQHLKEARELQKDHSDLFDPLIGFDEINTQLNDLGLEGLSDQNGLSKDDNLRLMKSIHLDEIVDLLMKGLSTVKKRY